MNAFLDNTAAPTVRHSECDYLTNSNDSLRCHHCSKYRKILHSMASRDKHSGKLSSLDNHHSKTTPSSHVNFRYLTSPEKVIRIHNLHDLQRLTKQRLERVSSRLQAAIEKKGVEIKEGLHQDLIDIMEANSSKIKDTETFQRLFWSQQKKAASLGNARSMRWHPLMIKWCLYLRHLSGKAYEVMRESGCIVLPSQRTLRPYHFKSTSGFSCDVDKQLMRAAKVEAGTEEWKRYVAILMDEMYVKEDLVFEKHTGALIGFANLGDTNDHLLKFQHSIEEDTDCEKLAKTMCVFMVRRIFQRIEFPYAQFPCANVTGELMFDPFWEVIYRLERLGLKVCYQVAHPY